MCLCSVSACAFLMFHVPRTRCIRKKEITAAERREKSTPRGPGRGGAGFRGAGEGRRRGSPTPRTPAHHAPAAAATRIKKTHTAHTTLTHCTHIQTDARAQRMGKKGWELQVQSTKKGDSTERGKGKGRLKYFFHLSSQRKKRRRRPGNCLPLRPPSFSLVGGRDTQCRGSGSGKKGGRSEKGR